MLLAISLRHDPAKTLEQVNAELAGTGFKGGSAPRRRGVERMMGMGQVVAGRLPPSKPRALDLLPERKARGCLPQRVLATCDFRAAAAEQREEQP